MNTIRSGAYRARCAIVKHWGHVVAMALVAVLIGVGVQIVVGRTLSPFWIIFGGNGDTGDGHGGGAARDQMIAGGWTTADSSFQVTWKADIGQGTARITNEAMPAGHAAIAEHCRIRTCVVAGFSLGTAPAIQLAGEAGVPPENLWVFGGPYSATGLFHSKAPDHPSVEPFIVAFGGLQTDRRVPAGAHAVFHVRDPYANAAPQCYGPGVFTLTLAEHRIVSRGEAWRVWTGPDGVLNHEAGYLPPPALPASGADEMMWWTFCPPPPGWHSDNPTPAEPGPVPGVPGVPNPQDTPAPAPLPPLQAPAAP